METQRKIVHIAPDGSGDFTTLTEAVAAHPQHTPVHFIMAAGVYKERPFIELDEYCITGAGAENTIISAGVGGRDPWPGEAKTGTFRSQTLFLGGKNARVENLCVENTAGDGAKAGQALAVYADAARVCMVGVKLLGNQDTLFTSPLPLAVREPNGFRGPRENTPRLDTVQYYRDCTIAGNIDFIFGGANAVFDHCTIVPVPHESRISYITAACTPEGKPGYLFANCTVRGNCPAGSVYLGRPWRKFAKVYWLDCRFSEEVCAAGWDNWNNAENEKTVDFGEYGSVPATDVSVRSFGSVEDASKANFYREMLAKFRAEFAE